jgi:putative membrane protein
LAVLAALSFTAVNQALVGALRGIGWFLSMLVAVVAVAAGLVEAVPSAIQSVGAAVPTGPAIDALRSVLSGQGQVGGAVALLVVWGAAALAVTVLAVERQRSLRSVTMLTKSPTAA